MTPKFSNMTLRVLDFKHLKRVNGSQLAKLKKYIPDICPCYKIYREEAVGLKKFQLYLKNYDFCEYVKFGATSWKNWYLVNNCLIKVQIQKIFLHIGDTYNCHYLQHTTFRFYLFNFQLNTDFPSQFCVFTVKSPSVTQRSVSQENAFEKSKKPVVFFYSKL